MPRARVWPIVDASMDSSAILALVMPLEGMEGLTELEGLSAACDPDAKSKSGLNVDLTWVCSEPGCSLVLETTANTFKRGLRPVCECVASAPEACNDYCTDSNKSATVKMGDTFAFNYGILKVLQHTGHRCAKAGKTERAAAVAALDVFAESSFYFDGSPQVLCHSATSATSTITAGGMTAEVASSCSQFDDGFITTRSVHTPPDAHDAMVTDKEASCPCTGKGTHREGPLGAVSVYLQVCGRSAVHMPRGAMGGLAVFTDGPLKFVALSHALDNSNDARADQYKDLLRKTHVLYHHRCHENGEAAAERNGITVASVMQVARQAMAAYAQNQSLLIGFEEDDEVWKHVLNPTRDTRTFLSERIHAARTGGGQGMDSQSQEDDSQGYVPTPGGSPARTGGVTTRRSSKRRKFTE